MDNAGLGPAKIRKAVDSGDSDAMESTLAQYLGQFLEELNDTNSFFQLYGNNSEIIIFKYLEAITYLLNYHLSNNILNSSAMIELLLCLFPRVLIFPNQTYSFKLWKTCIDVFSLLFYFNFSTETQFEIPLNNIFNYCAPTDPTKYPDYAFKRIATLFESINENYPNTVTKWLNFLAQNVFSRFYRYFNMSTQQPTADYDQLLPQKYVDIIANFILSRNFIDFYTIYDGNPPTHFSFLIRFAEKTDADYPNKYLRVIDVIGSKWIKADLPQRNQIIRLCKTRAPDSIANLLMILSSKLLYKVSKMVTLNGSDPTIIPESDIPSFINIYQRYREECFYILNDNFKISYLGAIIKEFLNKAPFFGLIVYYQFLFDFQAKDNSLFSFASDYNISVGNQTAQTVANVFISLVAICFSPFFFEITKESVQQYIEKTNQRIARGVAPPINFNPDSIQIFTDNISFLLSILPNLNPEYSKQMINFLNHNKCLFVSLSAEKWNLESALSWVQLFFQCNPQSFGSFLITLNEIQKIIPRNLQKNCSFIYQTLFPQIIKYLHKFLPSTTLFDAITSSINFSGYLPSETDPMIATKWITVLCRFLCHVDISIVTLAVKPAIYSLVKFVPQSMVLIYLVLGVLTDNPKIVSFEEIEQFVLNSIVICGYYNSKVEKMFDLSEVSKSWSKETVNHSLIDKTILLFKKEPFLFQKTLISILSNFYQKQSFNATACIYIQELTLPMSPFMDFIVKNFEIYFTNDISDVDNRLLALLATQYIGTKSTNPDFVQKLCKYMRQEIRRNNDPNERWILFSALCSLLRAGILNSRKFFKTLEIYSYEDSTLGDIFVDIFPQIFTNKSILLDKQEAADCLLNADAKVMLYITETESHSHKVDFRLLNYAWSGQFIQIPQKPVITQNNITMPETEDDEIDIGNRNVLRDFFINKFSIQISQPNDFQMISAPKNPVDVDYEYSPPLNIVNIEVKEKSAFFDLMRKLPSFMPIYKYFYSYTNVKVFEPTPAMLRESRAIFQCGTKEEVKIGVIYVKPGQFTQNEILSNSHIDVSPQYDSFIKGLGTPVDIEKHKYYSGKLEPTVSPFSIFYSDDEYDVMFHVATLIKNSADDMQQLAKKRHIGNDNVHIVWCENKLGYDQDAITSHFNDAHIIITPLNDDLYHIIIYKKKKEYNFGPLPSGVLVRAKALVPLVRMTAINADRVVRKDWDAFPMKKLSSLLTNIQLS